MSNVIDRRSVELRVKAAQELGKKKARDNYYEYVQYVHNGFLKRTKFHEYLCGRVQEFIESPPGPSYDILIIQTAPQHGKSVHITETLPSYCLGKHPDRPVMEISYSQEFAQRFGRYNRQKIVEHGKELFNVEISDDNASATDFTIKGHRGGMVSKSISTITGRPSYYMIIDDPISSREDADSQTYRDKLWDEWLNSAKSRLAAGAKVVCISTRWHEDDLPGRMIANEKNVTVLRFPCECEDENDLLGREIGEALCPEIGKGKEWLEDFKLAYQSDNGQRAWNALFQQRPSSQEGNLIKREYWRYCDVLPGRMGYLMISVDASFKDTKNSDNVAIQLWGKRAQNFYLIGKITKRMDFLATTEAIRRMVQRCKDISGREHDMVGIEDKANGPAIISVLRLSVNGVVGITPKDSKEARVQSVLPLFEAGQVFIWTGCDEWRDVVDECASFPNGAHDDDVDAMSQALSRLRSMDAWIDESVKDRDDWNLLAKVSGESMTGGKIHDSYVGGWW